MMIPESNPTPLARMLVPLDAIFDTRLGTIGSFGTEAYRKVIESGYGGRSSDHFEGIDPVEYRKRYAERGAHTLTLSMTTHIVSVVKDFCARVNIASATSPIKAKPKVDVNIYPYKMPDRIAEGIVKHLKATVKEDADFGFVSYSPKELDFARIKHTYDHLVFYNIGEWFEAQAADWEQKNRCHNDVTVFFPMLCLLEDKSKIPDDISMMADDANRRLGTLFNPMQLPIQFFCSVFNATALAITPEAEAPSATEKKSSP